MTETQTWGSFDIAPGTTGQWQIGPLSLWIERFRSEWRIAHEQDDDSQASEERVAVPAEPKDLLAFEKVKRFGVSAQADRIQITPQLADRAVVTRPEKPFSIPSGEEVTIYVSSPLWVRISLAQPAKVLQEIPSFRPSDTWFGPTIRGGEICYASRTFCRLRLEEIKLRPHRALTAVHVKNRAETEIELERLNLPVTNLALYRRPDGVFWTQDVRFVREEDDEFAKLEIKSGPPRIDKKSELVAPPRSPEKHVIVRAFSSLLS